MKNLRAAVDRGEVLFGCFALLVEPPFIEVLGHVGFDFVVTDCEESPGDSYGGKLENLLRAADAAGLATITRPVENAPGPINRALNAGSHGLFIPHVRDADQARAIVQSARYPPLGRRGAAPTVRAARFGLEAWPTYHARANQDTLLLAMIEDEEAVGNIEEIVAVPGLDGILVGTWDLSVEMGEARYGPPAPSVMRHVEHVIEVTRGAGLIMAAHGWSAEAAAKYVSLGCQLLVVSLDSTLMLSGLRELRAIAETIEAL